jgi:DNA polymerase III subunit chi
VRVDFYFNAEHRLHYACRVVRKARAASLGVLVYSRSADLLARFDAALWTFAPLEFLPHVPVHSPLADETPVLLTHDLAACHHDRPMLLSLDDEGPDDLAALTTRFERLAEVVSVDDSERQLARARFRRYREAGLDPQHHDVGVAPG